MQQWWKYAFAPALGWIYFLQFISVTIFWDAAVQLWWVGLSFLGMASLGYFLNDWSDERCDKQAGKANLTSGLTLLTKLIISVLLVAMAIAPWTQLTSEPRFYMALAVEVFLLLLYSFKPFRLKERGWIAPIIDALYAHVLPSLLFLYMILEGISAVFVVAIIVWKLISGTRYFLNHLALDAKNDQRSGTATLATRYGVSALYRWNADYLFPAEILLISMVLSLGLCHVPLLIPVALLLVFVTVFWEQLLALDLSKRLNTYSFKRISLDDFYQTVLPLVALVGLTVLDKRYALLLLVHLTLFHGLLQFLWEMQWKVMVWVWELPYRQLASKVVNYTVYYFRKIVLCYNEEQARKTQYADYLKQEQIKNLAAKKRDNGRVAVVNINQAKYTETFIHGMVSHLPFEVHQLYGGELPTYSLNEGDFISESKWNKRWIEVVELLLGKPSHYFLKKAILSYIHRHEVQVVLAEFGPVGASLVEICAQADIPLVVHFHGYDAYHQQLLLKHGEAYKQMFAYATSIIAVSKEMKQQLVVLGAAEEKIYYQPDFVNLELYRHVDTSSNAPVCLSIGRFAETKSPHLTLLAFKRVLSVLPEAKLVMVGKDGGGELFEACHILVKSLGMDHAVTFKGVLPPSEIYGLMKSARIFVQHSLTTPLNGDKEGTPVAVMEASAAGLPVVATRHAGINDVVVHGKTGLLVDEYDIDAMANAIMELLQNDGLAQQMGAAGSEYIHHHPQVSHYIANLEQILKQAIRK